MGTANSETDTMNDASDLLRPQRTIVELKELRTLTGDDDGAQRVDFTPTWAKAREWLKGKMSELPVDSHTDAAGNLWLILEGEFKQCLIIGGHIDSVPNGGWLDGCLNLMAGVEILRRISAEFDGKQPVTVRLVDWADEEGAHSGSTPMKRRKDAFLAAAKMAPEIYQITDRHGGVGTIGSCVTKPGIVTSVVKQCRITLDQRHLNAESLANMLAEAKSASERYASEGNVSVTWERIWQIEPVPFDPTVIEFCDAAISKTCGKSHRMPSGPLHDAAEVSRAGIPTVMMFVQSLHGISHDKIEDTREEQLELGVKAIDRLARKTMEWIQRSPVNQFD